MFRKHNITPHIKLQNSLHSLLVAPKDPKDKLDRSGAVYGLKCGDCSASYVGVSPRLLRARIREHERTSSPVGEHATNKGHTIDWDNVSVLDRENDWYRRGVREAIHIERTNSTLNKGQGRHNLMTKSSCHHVTAPPPVVTPRNNPSFGFEGCRIAAAGYHSSNHFSRET